MSTAAVRLASLGLAAGVVAFVVGGFRNVGEIDIDECLNVTGRRARVLGYYVCSPQLLAGGARELFAFVWLWSFPTIAGLALVFPWLKSRFTPLSSSPDRN